MAQRSRSQVQNSTRSSASAVVSPTDENPFGGLSEEEVRATAESLLGDGPELAASDFSIALESIARAVAARMDHDDYSVESKRLAFFIISDRPRVLADRIGAVLEPIVDNGSKELCGWVVVTPVTCTSGYCVQLAGVTTAELFQEVVAKGAGNEAALVFDPNATDKELRYYPKGVGSPEVVQRFPFRTMTFTLPMLDRVLKRLHEEHLVTPDAAKGLGIWEDAEKYRPITDAEARLQGLMRLTLSIAFDMRLFSVWWEVPGTQGRCDLFVTSRSANKAGQLTAHAVLELKVLRSFSAGGSHVAKTVNAEAVKKGVGQARGYRKNKDALNAMLCCYDMRTPAQADGDKCFEPITSIATKHAIQLRSYRLYGSPDDLRADQTTS